MKQRSTYSEYDSVNEIAARYTRTLETPIHSGENVFELELLQGRATESRVNISLEKIYTAVPTAIRSFAAFLWSL